MFHKIIGWFQKAGMVEISPPSIHINEVADWVEQQTKEVMMAHTLEEETLNHVNLLKDKRWVLDNKLDGWQQGAKRAKNTEVGLLLIEIRKVLELLQFPEMKITIGSVLTAHEKIDALIDPLIYKIENSFFKDNFAVILPEGNSASAGQTSAGPAPANPVLQELQGIKALLQQFEQKIAISGYHKMKTLAEKSMQLDAHSDRLYQMQQQLKLFQEKQALVQQKQQEKEAELQVLQQNPAYNNFLAIKDQRAKLLQQIEMNDSFHERFELKQRVDQLGKAVGDKELLLKLEDLEYRLNHFRTQAQRLKEEIARVQDDLNDTMQLRQRETNFFQNLVKVSMGEEIVIKV